MDEKTREVRPSSGKVVLVATVVAALPEGTHWDEVRDNLSRDLEDRGWGNHTIMTVTTMPHT